MYIYIYIAAFLCLHICAYIHTYIYTYRQTDRQTDRQTYIHILLMPIQGFAYNYFPPVNVPEIVSAFFETYVESGDVRARAGANAGA